MFTPGGAEMLPEAGHTAPRENRSMHRRGIPGVRPEAGHTAPRENRSIHRPGVRPEAGHTAPLHRGNRSGACLCLRRGRRRSTPQPPHRRCEPRHATRSSTEVHRYNAMVGEVVTRRGNDRREYYFDEKYFDHHLGRSTIDRITATAGCAPHRLPHRRSTSSTHIVDPHRRRRTLCIPVFTP